MNWHIDTWAPTEGIVFASERASDVDLWETNQTPEPSTFLITAPGFDAQPVDRSIAFGALRRGFQERFSLDGRNEFSFASLDQITLFCRRIYSGSGPGTANGGGGEPLDPGPSPGNGGDDPRLSARRRQVDQAVSELPSGENLLTLLNESKDGQSHKYLEQFFTEDACWAASDLLRECLNPQSKSQFVQDDFALFSAALHLADFDQKVRLLADVLGAHHDPEVRYHLRRWERYGFGYLSALLPDQYCNTEIPKPLLTRKITADFKLPASVRTTLDALQFVCADRTYVASLPPKKLWPFLLALAAVYQIQKPALYGGVGWSARSPQPDFLRRCAEFLTRNLPVEPLPKVLEKELKKWSNLGPEKQRNRINEA